MTELTFEALPLAAPLKRALSEKGYTTPSPIQAAAIPVLLEGGDLLACAQTGTGKTAAFALPILQRLFTERRKTHQYKVRTLILTPTRELAVQIADSFRTYGKYMRMTLGLVHGGVSQRPQERALQGGLDVLVATPGRLIDLFEQGCMDLSEVETFVLDEADRMLDMGFIHDIRRIAKELPQERQTLLFSATMANEIAELAAKLLNNPKEIRIAPAATTAEKVEQRICFVPSDDKRALLMQLLDAHAEEDAYGLRLVFTKTKHGANRLAIQLNKEGIDSEAIHGNKSQNARLKALERFRNGKAGVLVATDVAARGIDVKDVTLVVNYDLPMEPDSYVHRIGRTARAGASGLAVSFCTKEEFKLLADIERLIRQDIPVDGEHNFHSDDLAAAYRNFASRGRGGKGGRNGFSPKQVAGQRGGRNGGFRKGGFGNREELAAEFNGGANGDARNDTPAPKRAVAWERGAEREAARIERSDRFAEREERSAERTPARSDRGNRFGERDGRPARDTDGQSRREAQNSRNREDGGQRGFRNGESRDGDAGGQRNFRKGTGSFRKTDAANGDSFRKERSDDSRSSSRTGQPAHNDGQGFRNANEERGQRLFGERQPREAARGGVRRGAGRHHPATGGQQGGRKGNRHEAGEGKPHRNSAGNSAQSGTHSGGKHGAARGAREVGHRGNRREGSFGDADASNAQGRSGQRNAGGFASGVGSKAVKRFFRGFGRG